jgi:hypothetical protein
LPGCCPVATIWMDSPGDLRARVRCSRSAP